MDRKQLVVGRRYRAMETAPVDMFLLGENEKWENLGTERFYQSDIRRGTEVELLQKEPYILKTIDDTAGIRFLILPARLLGLFIPLDEKVPAIEGLLDGVASMFGRDRKESMAGSICVSCGKSAAEFRDDLSRREYGISGLCQACQDSVFGTGDE